jgi:hypothetical protein
VLEILKNWELFLKDWKLPYRYVGPDPDGSGTWYQKFYDLLWLGNLTVRTVKLVVDYIRRSKGPKMFKELRSKLKCK